MLGSTLVQISQPRLLNGSVGEPLPTPQDCCQDHTHSLGIGSTPSIRTFFSMATGSLNRLPSWSVNDAWIKAGLN